MAIFGKRVIIIGGGAQVGQVAVGAISEADRHNIRGERISVDTIPLVGEEPLAGAVRAVGRLPRAQVLVLASALMGGAITDAVADLRRQGVIVISLNMAGSVPDAADLVVTDPLRRRDGGDGDRRHRTLRHHAAAQQAVLTPTGDPRDLLDPLDLLDPAKIPMLDVITSIRSSPHHRPTRFRSASSARGSPGSTPPRRETPSRRPRSRGRSAAAA
jgi:hypothetical protein